MRSRFFYIFAMLFISILGSGSANALTLDEYGITLTDDGLLDNHTGLQWLDAAATEGTTANLDPLFANGWRLATEQEMVFLLLRIPNSVGDTAISMLNFDDYLVMLDALSIPHLLSGSGDSDAWLCRADGGDTSHCNSSNGVAFVSFFLSVEPAPGFSGGSDSLTHVTFIPFISEAFLYGTFDTECLDCIGRSLLVRTVPLPASLWLIIGALLAIPRTK